MTSNEIVDKLKIFANELNLEVTESNYTLSMYIPKEGFCVLHFDKLRTQIWFQVRNEITVKMNQYGPTISVGDVYLVSTFEMACFIVKTFVNEYKTIKDTFGYLQKQYAIEIKKMNMEKDFE